MATKSNDSTIPSLSINLTHLRSKVRLTQEEFAERLSEISGGACVISSQTIAAFEQGRRTPTTTILYWICKCFNMSFDALLGLHPSDEPQESAPLKQPDTEDVIPQCGRKINAKDLYKYDKLPVYVKAPDNSFREGWAILDYPSKRFIFSTYMCSYNPRMEIYAYPPKESAYFNGQLLTPLTIPQVQNLPIVWVEMLNADPFIAGRYNGWYRHNEDKSALVNVSNSLVLLYSGLGISYNAYNIDSKQA